MFNFIRSIASSLLHKVADVVAPAKSDAIPEFSQLKVPKFSPENESKKSELFLRDLMKDPNLGVSFDPRISLDVETLLRNHCERCLSITNPTNVAVFLPTSSGDYSLGAFVNYEKPKETIDSVLDGLCDKIAKPVEQGLASGILVANKFKMFTPEEREKFFSGEVFGLDDRYFLLAPVVVDGETFAIVTIFRDNAPFRMDLSRLNSLVEEFGSRLVRIVRTHFRCVAPNDWGAIGDDESSSATDP